MIKQHNQRTKDFIGSYVSDIISEVDYDLWKEIYDTDEPDDPDTVELVNTLYHILVEFYHAACDDRIDL